MNLTILNNGIKAISNEIGLLHHIAKLPRMNFDPLMVDYGIWASNTEYLIGEKYGIQSSGCGYKWEDALLGTIGETVERYAACFYDLNDSIFASYKHLEKQAIHPSEFALFHKVQYNKEGFILNEFTEDIELTWFPTIDLTNGKETFLPGQFIYMPFRERNNKYITSTTSTGLAAHTDYYKAILTGIFEAIERDSFVITWMQNIVSEKIVITNEIKEYIDEHFPAKYEWHFFDITYDINVPTILGFCFGGSDFGKFIASASATRATYGEALIKVIQEIGQAIPYFRYILDETKEWIPSDDFNLINNFEKHSILYTKRQDLCHIFDKWIQAKESKEIDLFEKPDKTDKDEVRKIVEILKDKNYNVLFKDITTYDIRQLGFYSIKVFVPQLIQLSGSYPVYFSGGKRLFSVPEKLGFKSNDYQNLNKYPHPFP